LLGNRTLPQVVRALFGRHHYVALNNMWRLYPKFSEYLWRYLTAKGQYPCNVSVRTPAGLIQLDLYNPHDFLTVNEIFCRLDYQSDKNLNVVVDIGSNIGISARYFLSRNAFSKCYLFEPNPANINKLMKQLDGFEKRYILSDAAVADRAGSFEFGIEESGRYGGIGVETGSSILVTCLDINSVLGDILKKESRINILKIDTEGVEIATVKAIAPDIAKKIDRIYIEAQPSEALQPDIFSQIQYGSVCQLVNRII